MTQTKVDSKMVSAERKSIRNRVERFYDSFNREDWATCYSLIDPQLRDNARVNRKDYESSLDSFKKCYGRINRWYMRISPHIDASNSRDERPFAYVYIVWQDERRRFHMFRERWIKTSGSWYTRIVGLVSHKEKAAQPTSA